MDRCPRLPPSSTPHWWASQNRIPAIFTPALDALNIDPAKVVYIGDTVHADVVGATNAGMQVVQLDPFDQHTDFDHARMRDLDELVAALA
jgi:FMN phosphatase YigB (HAD superfamily)